MNANAVVIADRDGVIQFWSAGAEARFGHSAEAAVGQRVDLIVPDEYREIYWRGFHAAMASATAGVEGQVGPFPAKLASGEIEAHPGRLTLLRNADGAAIGAMVVFG